MRADRRRSARRFASRPARLHAVRTPDEAIAAILERVASVDEVESVPLVQADERVLAQDVVSDVDLPPFEKSAMDGFAVKSADFANARGPVTLRVVGESRAGAPFDGVVEAGDCIGMYTGAEVPPSCDAVVMVEKSALFEDRVRLDDVPAHGQHICRRGEDLRAGDTVLTRGRRLSAIDLAVLAAVGCEPVPVFRRPRLAVLTTGDELVPAHDRPRAGEIREGNTFYLAARARAAGALVSNLGIVRDDERELEVEFRRALAASDALITTGGVSMGKYDLVGAMLERCGVVPVFHKVAIKPGKPIWFGMHERVPVFGLPGNPVSCLIGFEVFVRPALARMSGASDEEHRERHRRGRWLGNVTRENPRQQHIPVRIEPGEDGVDRLEPITWSSSADITGLTRADGLAVIDAGRVLAHGELVDYRALRGLR